MRKYFFLTTIKQVVYTKIINLLKILQIHTDLSSHIIFPFLLCLCFLYVANSPYYHLVRLQATDKKRKKKQKRTNKDEIPIKSVRSNERERSSKSNLMNQQIRKLNRFERR